MANKGADRKKRTYAPTLTNRKARHKYAIVEAVEAGIALRGTEVKSIRNSEVSLDEAFARIRDGEVWLIGCHIKPYEFADPGKQDPLRARKLLLHRRQIHHLAGLVAQKGVTLVPLSMYFKDGRVKVELAVARGRRQFDKRQALRKKEDRREIQRAMRRRESRT